MRRVLEEPKQDNPHYFCGKVDKWWKFIPKCTGCNMMGSHKEDLCWVLVLHPHLKSKDSGNTRGGTDRGRRRDRTRSKSQETEEDRSKKKGRDKSPFPSEALRRVTSEKQ